LNNPKENKETAPVKTKKSSPKDKESKDDKKEPLAKSDYALYEALNLLKGLSIVNVKAQ
jgi:carboxyl-terminal processing protease